MHAATVGKAASICKAERLARAADKRSRRVRPKRRKHFQTSRRGKAPSEMLKRGCGGGKLRIDFLQESGLNRRKSVKMIGSCCSVGRRICAQRSARPGMKKEPNYA